MNLIPSTNSKRKHRKGKEVGLTSFNIFRRRTRKRRGEGRGRGGGNIEFFSLIYILVALVPFSRFHNEERKTMLFRPEERSCRFESSGEQGARSNRCKNRVSSSLIIITFLLDRRQQPPPSSSSSSFCSPRNYYSLEQLGYSF